MLITQNHLNVQSDLEKINVLKKIEIEPRNANEAKKYAKVADVMLLGHFTPDEILSIKPHLKKN